MPHIDSFDDIHKVYLIGICGTAMASLAGMLQQRGYEVTGSDENVYPPMSTYLENLGIPILEGYTGEHLETFRPDLVVVGNAAAKTNAEAAWTLEHDLPYTSMPETIYELFIKGKHSIVITGTHGKTSATSLMAWLLESAGRDPGYVVGGIPVNFGHNFKLGDGAEFVIEGDEYNTAFFDKGPKFLHYQADSLLLNNIEFDHADLYDSLDTIIASFRAAVEQTGPDDLIVANGDDENVMGLREHARGEWLTFGQSEACDVRVVDIDLNPEGASFGIVWKGNEWSRFHSPMSGVHNVLNAAATLAIARRRGVEAEVLQKGLETFRGIKRRMEVRGIVRGVTVIDDFAHHPTAIATTLDGARKSYPNRRIWALYEPRSATSARTQFEQGYKESFRKADLFILGPIFHKNRYGKSYPAESLMSVDGILEDLGANGIEAVHIESFDEIAEHVARKAKEGDVVIAMSSGSFGGIHDKLLEALGK